MKILILLISLVTLTMTSNAQNRIIDAPNSIKLCKANDTVVINKSPFLTVLRYYDKVLLYMGNVPNQGKAKGSGEIEYSDYSTQFANVSSMFSFLKKALTNEYDAINYHWTGDNMDTASYVIGTDTTYQKVFIYSGANVITSKVIYP